MCNCRPQKHWVGGWWVQQSGKHKPLVLFPPPTPSPYGHTSILERIVKVLSTGGGVQHPPDRKSVV